MPADKTVRACISLKKSLDRKIRSEQTKVILAEGKNYTYSKAISDILEEYFRK